MPDPTPSEAILGYGAAFLTGNDATPTVYTEVAEISTINFNGFTVDSIDVSHLKSPGKMKESKPGLLAPGTIDLTGNFTGAASQQTLTSLGQNRTIFPWQITSTLDNGSSYTVSGKGFVSKLAKGPFSAGAKVDFSVSIQVNGAFTETITEPEE